MTDEDASRDLQTAARWILDPDLRRHIQAHAEDKSRQARRFRERAADLHAGDSDRAGGRERAGHDVELLSFYSPRVCDEFGEIAYVAMLHVAEKRVRGIFEIQEELHRDDPETRAIFTEILGDGNGPVEYTGRFLEQWRDDGYGATVRQAMKNARSSRFFGAWRRLGVRSGAGFSHAVLYFLYWTVLLPFGLIGRRSRRRPNVRTNLAAPDLKSQY